MCAWFTLDMVKKKLLHYKSLNKMSCRLYALNTYFGTYDPLYLIYLFLFWNKLFTSNWVKISTICACIWRLKHSRMSFLYQIIVYGKNPNGSLKWCLLQHFEELVGCHFRTRAHAILSACRAYMEGVPVGSITDEKIPNERSGSRSFQAAVARMLNGLISNFSRSGATDCDQFRVWSWQVAHNDFCED